MAEFFIAIAVFLVVSGCSDQNKILELKAEIVLPARDQEIREGEFIFFEGTASGGRPPYTYRWDFGKTMPPINKKESGQVVFNYEGAYKVMFVVQDFKGDKNSDAVRIIVTPKSFSSG